MTDEPARYTRHNHITRDIKPAGKCPACDYYHAQQAAELLKGPMTLGFHDREYLRMLAAEEKLRKIRDMVKDREGEDPANFPWVEDLRAVLDSPTPDRLDPEWVKKNVPR